MKRLKMYLVGFILMALMVCTGVLLWSKLPANHSNDVTKEDESIRNGKSKKDEKVPMEDSESFTDDGFIQLLNDKGMIEFAFGDYEYADGFYSILYESQLSVRVDQTITESTETLKIPSQYEGEDVQAVNIQIHPDTDLSKKIKTVEFPHPIKLMFGNLSGSHNLTNVKLNNEIFFIDDNFFADCVSLKEVILPHNLRYVSKGMFQGCETLEKIVIPENVYAIFEKPFEGCKNLREVTIPESVKVIDPTAFYGVNENVKIITVWESAAEKFAKENNITLEYEN